MALRKTIDAKGNATIRTDFGVIENGTQTVSFSAYIKVVEIYGSKEKLTATVNFKGDHPIQFNKQYEIPVSVETGSANFIAQAYAHLKTLDEFAGAVNC
jgi:hypothetical protein